MTEHTFLLALDPTLRGGMEPANAVEASIWAYLDTAYNVLREGAAVAVLDGLRADAKAAGYDFPSDEELLAETGLTYHSLGAQSPTVGLVLAKAFSMLVAETDRSARAALAVVSE